MALTGRAALVAVLGAVAVLALPAPPGLVVLVWLAVLLVAIAVDTWRAAPLRAVRVEREAVTSVRLGEPTASSLLLTNTGPRTLTGLARDAWQPSAGVAASRHRVSLAPGERRRVVTPMLPTRRGDRQATAVVLRSYGPLGLAARQRTVASPASVRVLPAFASRKHLPSRLARLREMDGRTTLNVRGQGTEFDSLRDYVAGDDVRSVDWRATARRQQVVVRTWRPERDRRVLLVLDTSRTSAARVGDAPRLDAAMDAALLLAALANRAGDRVDLLAIDRRVRAQVVGAAGPGLLHALVEAMAPLEADLVETDWPTVVAAIRARTTHRTLVVLLTTLDTAAVEEGLLPVLPGLTSRHQVLLASVTDPRLDELAAGRGDLSAVYGAAAAARAELDRDGMQAELARLGVEVVTGHPEELAPRLADRYLALKAAGRL